MHGCTFFKWASVAFAAFIDRCGDFKPRGCMRFLFLRFLQQLSIGTGIGVSLSIVGHILAAADIGSVFSVLGCLVVA